MMYIWNGYSVIGKCPDLTENMLEYLADAETILEKSPGNPDLVSDASLQRVQPMKEIVLVLEL